MVVFYFQFIVDRIIQDFRARSQLLVSQHEEEDEVVCTLSDTSESEDEADEEPSRYVTLLDNVKYPYDVILI